MAKGGEGSLRHRRPHCSWFPRTQPREGCLWGDEAQAGGGVRPHWGWCPTRGASIPDQGGVWTRSFQVHSAFSRAPPLLQPQPQTQSLLKRNKRILLAQSDTAKETSSFVTVRSWKGRIPTSVTPGDQAATDATHTIPTLTLDRCQGSVSRSCSAGRQAPASSFSDRVRATRMGSRAVRAQLYKHLDVERKVAKQAEARLKQRLQQLEAARLRRLAQLAREQRQLQAQRQRLWEAGIVRKKRSSYFGNGIQKRPEAVRVSPPQGAWTHGAPQAGGVRAPATNMAQETHKPKSQMPPSCHTGLRDPTQRCPVKMRGDVTLGTFYAMRPRCVCH
ncbi:coiled-coil domain-containing protein 190 isoform 3-T3 [Hipposideros larvatus]